MRPYLCLTALACNLYLGGLSLVALVLLPWAVSVLGLETSAYGGLGNAWTQSVTALASAALALTVPGVLGCAN